MQLAARIVARSYFFAFLKSLIFTKVNAFTFIKCKKDIYVLPRIIYGIMTLEIEESSWTSHCTDSCNKRKTFTTFINGTCCASLHCQIRLLSKNLFTWPLWIRVPVVLFTNFKKIRLSG